MYFVRLQHWPALMCAVRKLRWDVEWPTRMALNTVELMPSATSYSPFSLGPGEIVFPSRSKHSTKKKKKKTVFQKPQQKYVLEMDRLQIILGLRYVKWLILSLSILPHVIFSFVIFLVILQRFFLGNKVINGSTKVYWEKDSLAIN